MSNGNELLQMTGIVKEFPGVRALDGVDLDVRRGEVHCLLGQNGAGKSTLIRVLTGAHQPDAGTIQVDGRELHSGAGFTRDVVSGSGRAIAIDVRLEDGAVVIDHR